MVNEALVAFMFRVNDASPWWIDKCHWEAKFNQDIGRELPCVQDHCIGERRPARERIFLPSWASTFSRLRRFN